MRIFRNRNEKLLDLQAQLCRLEEQLRLQRQDNWGNRITMLQARDNGNEIREKKYKRIVRRGRIREESLRAEIKRLSE